MIFLKSHISNTQILNKRKRKKNIWGGGSYVNSIRNCQIRSSDAKIQMDKTKETHTQTESCQKHDNQKDNKTWKKATDNTDTGINIHSK